MNKVINIINMNKKYKIWIKNYKKKKNNLKNSNKKLLKIINNKNNKLNN